MFGSRLATALMAGLLVVGTTYAGPAAAATDSTVPHAKPDRIVLNPTVYPGSTQLLTWRTSPSVTSGYVQVRRYGETRIITVKQRRTRIVTPSASANKARHHSAALTGLESNALYSYRAGTPGNWSGWSAFRAAADTDDWDILGFGDTQKASAAWLRNIVESAFRKSPKPGAMIQIGDIVDNPRDDQQWHTLFDAFGTRLRNVNLFYTPGNHEQCILVRCDDLDGQAYRGHFSFAKNTATTMSEDWYYSDINNARIISLNAFRYLWDQKHFLEAALESNKKQWTVVMLHAPFFSSTKSRSNASLRKTLLPVLEKYNVDLVLAGHDHVYSRGHMRTNGPVYAVSVSSPKFYSLDDGSDWSENGATRVVAATQAATFQVVSFDGATMTYRAVIAAKGATSRTVGETLDSFTITKLSDGTKRVTSP